MTTQDKPVRTQAHTGKARAHLPQQKRAGPGEHGWCQRTDPTASQEPGSDDGPTILNPRSVADRQTAPSGQRPVVLFLDHSSRSSS